MFTSIKFGREGKLLYNKVLTFFCHHGAHTDTFIKKHSEYTFSVFANDCLIYTHVRGLNLQHRGQNISFIIEKVSLHMLDLYRGHLFNSFNRLSQKIKNSFGFFILTLSASISLWYSSSQYLGRREKMEFSVTWLPNCLSNQSASKSLEFSNNTLGKKRQFNWTCWAHFQLHTFIRGHY